MAMGVDNMYEKITTCTLLECFEMERSKYEAEQERKILKRKEDNFNSSANVTTINININLNFNFAPQRAS
jgi:predicted Zn-dependent protease